MFKGGKELWGVQRWFKSMGYGVPQGGTELQGVHGGTVIKGLENNKVSQGGTKLQCVTIRQIVW